MYVRRCHCRLSVLPILTAPRSPPNVSFGIGTSQQRPIASNDRLQSLLTSTPQPRKSLASLKLPTRCQWATMQRKPPLPVCGVSTRNPPLSCHLVRTASVCKARSHVRDRNGFPFIGDALIAILEQLIPQGMPRDQAGAHSPPRSLLLANLSTSQNSHDRNPTGFRCLFLA